MEKVPYKLACIITLVICCFTAITAYADEPETGKLFKGTSATLYYEIHGNGTGTPLFVLHGGPGLEHRYFHYSSAFDALSKGRKVIFYDQRGCGQSPILKAEEPWLLKDQITDLDELRAYLGFERIDVFGHSWGGFLAMAYAARHPERINKLILCASAAPKFSDTIFLFEQVFPESKARQKALEFAENLGDKKAMDAGMKEYWSQVFYSPEKRESFLAKSASLKMNYEILYAYEKDLSRFDLIPELAKFRFPVLVVTGRYDMNVAPLVAYKIHKAIDGSQFEVLERSSHYPFFEEPDDFVRIMDKFLLYRHSSR